ncbi:MAG TPA: NUDIX domain-containing protein [Candidatus Limnocylindrales bacterium]
MPARRAAPARLTVPAAGSSAPPLAATVVILRPGAPGVIGATGASGAEALLIHRPTSMAFGPGLHAFPGGRVDPADAAAAEALGTESVERMASSLARNVADVEAAALHVAAVREVAEEVGVWLDPAALVPIAHWTTPPFMPRRFATWFFVADLPPDAEPVFAADEVAAHRWMTPAAALDAMSAGEIQMWVPTTSVLERLIEIQARSAAEVAARVHVGLADPPHVVEAREDRVVIESSGAGGLPGRRCRTTIWGRDATVIVDPGDPSEASIGLIRETAERRGRVEAVVLTQPDPDHAGGAEALAIPLEVSVMAAPTAGRRLPYAIGELGDGERLPADVDLRVRLGPPGSGRLAIVPSAGE